MGVLLAEQMNQILSEEKVEIIFQEPRAERATDAELQCREKAHRDVRMKLFKKCRN